MEDTRDFSALLTHKCIRKESRRTKKNLGAMCRVAFHKHKNVANVIQEKLNVKTAAERKRDKRRRQRERRAAERRETEAAEEDELAVFTREAAVKRDELLAEDAEAEQAKIDLLERRLGLAKKASKRKRQHAEAATDGDEDPRARKKNAERYVDDLLAALDEKEDDGDATTSENVDDDEEDDRSDQSLTSSNHEDEDIESLPSSVDDKKDVLSDEEEDDLDSSDDREQSDVKEVEAGKLAKQPEVDDFDPAVMALARRARLGTHLRERIFCTLMSGGSVVDAFERLKALDLEGADERELLHVCVHCTLLETPYNPFYSRIVGRLCEWSKQFRLTAQFAVWDMIKGAPTLKPTKFENLVALAADLIQLNAIGLAVFKTVNFNVSSTLPDSPQQPLAFVRRVLHRLLTKAPDAAQRQAFLRLVNAAAGRHHRRFTADFENFVGRMEADDFRSLPDFPTFQRQLAVVKRLFAVR